MHYRTRATQKLNSVIQPVTRKHQNEQRTQHKPLPAAGIAPSKGGLKEFRWFIDLGGNLHPWLGNLDGSHGGPTKGPGAYDFPLSGYRGPKPEGNKH